jgi:dTMP kinase
MIHQAGKITDLGERIQFLDWLAELEFVICGIPKPDKVLFLDVPPEVSQRLVEKKEARDYIKNGSNKDIHEADDHHMDDAYNAALQVVKHFSDTWETVECCKDRDILPIDTITKKILSSITGKNMNQVVQDKMKREILAVKNEFLFANIERKTKVYTREEIDLESIILENYEFKVR